jgi:hypothetical protein
MRPFYSTKTFSGNQEVTWEVTVYETPNTIASKGIIYRPASMKSTFGDSIDFSTATLAAMNTHFDNNTTPGLVDSNGDEVYGRIPVIYDYWGAQSPLGVYSPGLVALRFKGYVKTSGNYGFGVFGNGGVKIFHESSSVLYSANITETSPAYTTSLGSYTAGDQIDIFYWGKNLDWGGLAIRVFSDSNVADSEDIDWDLMREQDVLSASWMDSDESVNSFTLEEALEVEIAHNEGQLSTCSIPVVLGGDSDIMGWQFDQTNKYLSRIGSSDIIKKGTLISVTGGYTGEEHPSFTGHIVDISPTKNTAILLCESVESRLTRQLSENLPDKLSYAAHGYYERTGVSNPVFGVPAYDHWPYEYALKDMMIRGWIDASLFNAKKEMRRAGQSSSEEGEDLFRIRGLADQHIRIQRQPNYGNPYGDASLPEDDEYLTTSELTKSIYDRITDMTDRIGYFFGSDYEGNMVTKPRNNPSSLVHIDSGGTDTVHPAAIKGEYQAFTGGAWSKVLSNIKASRIDLVIVKSPGAGSIDVDITRSEDSWTDSITIDTSYSEEVLYYDQVYSVDLTNITSIPVVSGEEYATYTLTITPNDSNGAGLNALRVFETDPGEPIAEFNLSTLENIIELSGKSNIRDHINDAIVTGALKATLTDSQKVFQNIVKEYVVSRSTDIHAILNPNATNYDGRKITAFLSNAAIADQELANWTSRALVSQYRLPEPSISATHTAIPSLELGDPVYVEENQFGKFDATKVYWVTGFKTMYKPASAVTTIELTPFAFTPSFEPREEIDISLYNNKPIINLNISYPSLSGSGTISNPAEDLPEASTLSITETTVQNDGSYYITVPTGTPSPGTELLYVETDDIWQTYGGTFQNQTRYFKNNPYQKFFSKSGTRLDFDFEMADNSSPYGPDGWNISTGSPAIYNFHKIQDVYSGTSPFYDPYYSELPIPELITISFDALISGYYRISIVDARNSTQPLTVAWLTEPVGEEKSEEQHWTYVTAGPDKIYYWDGVDNLGEWNVLQSEEYSWRQRSNFSMAENPAIGKGFYAQNDVSTAMTHISDELESSEVCYPIGKYATFFVKIEVMRETNSELLVVDSKRGEDPADYPDNEKNDHGHLLDTNASYLNSRFIHYHLPPPNTATISVEDWNWGVGGDYDPDNPTDNWTSADNDCTFRDTKPVKIGITAQERRGAKFTSADDTAIKVHRVVHLSTQIWDQTGLIFGEVWNNRSPSIYKKRVLSRRINMDEYTSIYKDPYFTLGDDIADWVFYPSLFIKDFGRGEEEINYLDYLQMIEVPLWNPGRRIGEDRSRHIMAMMGYLFYFSVFTQDRSGRLVWCIDDTFVDKSKITNNTDTTEFPDDLERHQRRTIYVRQWWDYDLLNAELGTKWNIGAKYFGGYADRFDWHSRSAGDVLYPTKTGTYSNNVENANLDPYITELYNRGRVKLDGISGTAPFSRELGSVSGGVPSTVFGTGTVGQWSWETDGFVWVPCISRDFHPFYIIPPMGLCGYLDEDNKTWWEQNMWPAVSDDHNGDEALHDNWFTIINDRTVADFTTLRMHPGRLIEDKYNNAQVPTTVIEYQKQDDSKLYEHCRGGYTNLAGDSRDPALVVGGDPYYINAKLYRYFGHKIRIREKNSRWYNDVWRKGWWFLTFRHTYNWESASMFPVGVDGMLLPGALDADKTGSPVKAQGFDPGAYTGWKDDHPSSQQQGVWAETGSASEIHWRNQNVNLGDIGSWSNQAGGSNTIENPEVNLTGEDLPTYANPKNIFRQFSGWPTLKDIGLNPYVFASMMPQAVGPRLPETRRVLMATTLVNNRRYTPVT